MTGEESYEVEFSSRAARAFLKLPREAQQRLAKRIDALSKDPRPIGCEKLTGLDAYRVRVGDYRVVYDVDDGARIVTIANVGHRREVYRG